MNKRDPGNDRRRTWRASAIGMAAAATLALLGAPATAATGSVQDPAPVPKTVVYVEVNSNDFGNVADYTLAGSGAPVFDLAAIFAANINYDGQNAYLYLNDRVTWTLENAQTQIRPVQARGTKVLLSILGNHQGAGFANFPSFAAADAFAKQLADAVTEYRLDGIDLDDEWAEYGNNGTPQPNDSSFIYLLTALRDRLGPNKLITFYNIGPSAAHTSYDGVDAGSLLDYAWNPYYGAWLPPAIPGMDASREGAAAVDLTQTSSATTTQLARRTADEGYGVFVTYNLVGGDQSARLSTFTRVLHGQDAVYQQLDPDQIAAGDVTVLLNALSEPEDCTLADRGQVLEARAAYDALTLQQQQLVPDDAVARLVADEQRLTPPQMSFVTPGSGETLSGTVPVTVSLASASGLEAYNLRLDSAGLQYQWQPAAGQVTFSWDTTSVPNGVHTLLITATDVLGNKTTVTEQVTIANPPAWAATAAYGAGDRVSYTGAVWQAMWWTQNQQPGDVWGPWEEIVTAADGTAVWTASRVFVAGDRAVYQGKVYQAKWWTRNQAPGDPDGPWGLVG